jgi:hypothetical protein
LTGGPEQAAFFILAATEIITVKVFALFSSGSFHNIPVKEKASVLILTSHSPDSPMKIADRGRAN